MLGSTTAAGRFAVLNLNVMAKARLSPTARQWNVDKMVSYIIRLLLMICYGWLTALYLRIVSNHVRAGWRRIILFSPVVVVNFFLPKLFDPETEKIFNSLCQLMSTWLGNMKVGSGNPDVLSVSPRVLRWSRSWTRLQHEKEVLPMNAPYGTGCLQVIREMTSYLQRST